MAYLQSAKTHPAANVGATTVAATFTNPVAAGSLLVAWCTSDDGGGPTGVADSVNGAWTPKVNNTSWAVRGDIYFFKNSAVGTPTVTVSFGASVSNRCVYIAEYSSVDTTSPDDKSSGNGTGTGTTSPTTNACALPSADGELFFAGLYCSSDTVAVTAGTALSYTKRLSASDSFSYTGAIEDAIQTTAATAAADWSLDQSLAYVSCLATFKAAIPPATGTTLGIFDPDLNVTCWDE